MFEKIRNKKPLVAMMALCGVMMLGRTAKTQDAAMNPNDTPKPPGFGVGAPNEPKNLKIPMPPPEAAVDPSFTCHVQGGHYLIVHEGTQVRTDEKRLSATLALRQEAVVLCDAGLQSDIKSPSEEKVVVNCGAGEDSHAFAISCEEGTAMKGLVIGRASGAYILCVPK